MASNITDFNFSQLTARQPLIITDYVKDTKPLIESWFKYNIITPLSFIEEKEEQKWEYNKYKYLFVKANKDTEIVIYKAGIYKTPPTEEDRIIVIKLEANQSLIIPYRWKYFIKTKEEVELWGIDDYITFFVGLLF